MTVFNGFVSPTLGMMAQSHSLNTIGVNLANVNTGGFKSTETRFSTILSDTLDKQSDLGGVKPKDFQRIDQQGTVVSSLSDLDVAVNGRGFFIVNSKFDGTGQTLYTRDGSFEIATQGTDTATVNGATVTVKKAYLVDKNGYFVQGLERDATTGTFPLTGTLKPLRVDQFAFSNTGEATTAAELRLNLPANDAAGSTQLYNIDVFDSTGKQQSATLTFTKGSTVNQWTVTATTSQTAVAQVETVTLGGTVEAGDTYSATVNGNTVTYTTTGAEANLDAVRDGLVTAINNDGTVGAVVTAAAGAAGALTLTAKSAGTAFTATSAAAHGGTSVAQVQTYTIGGAVEAGDQFNININGTTSTFTIGAEANMNAVRDAWVAQINLNPAINGAITAAAGAGAGEFTITSDAAGTAFTAGAGGQVDAGVPSGLTITSAATTANYLAVADNTAANSTTTANVVSTTTSAPTTLTFDKKGLMQTPTSLALALTFAGGGSASVALDISGITQFSGDFIPFLYTKNGFAASDLKRVTFDNQGHVLGVFENSTDRPIYKVPLAQFANPNSLEMKNGNVFAETEDSGTAKVVTAGGTGFATFLPNSRELSNVDLADEFTRMIVTQTAYNSSASVFRTVDEMTETARDLKR